MTLVEPYRETIPMRYQFSSRPDERVVALDEAFTVVTKSISWNSALATFIPLGRTTIDCWALTEHFLQQSVFRFSPSGEVAWRENEPRRGFTIGTERLGVFSLPIREPVLPVNTDAIKGEAREEGFEIPTEATLRCAEFIASKLPELGVSNSEVEIYPTPDGAVTVDVFRGPEGGRSSIILLCEGADRLQCLTHINEKNDRREVRLEAFPDEFVRRAFEELMEVQ